MAVSRTFSPPTVLATTVLRPKVADQYNVVDLSKLQSQQIAAAEHSVSHYIPQTLGL